MVGLLLDHDAPINAVSSNGETALAVARAEGKVDTVRKLLSRGAEG